MIKLIILFFFCVMDDRWEDKGKSERKVRMKVRRKSFEVIFRQKYV